MRGIFRRLRSGSPHGAARSTAPYRPSRRGPRTQRAILPRPGDRTADRQQWHRTKTGIAHPSSRLERRPPSSAVGVPREGESMGPPRRAGRNRRTWPRGRRHLLQLARPPGFAAAIRWAFGRGSVVRSQVSPPPAWRPSAMPARHQHLESEGGRGSTRTRRVDEGARHTGYPPRPPGLPMDCVRGAVRAPRLGIPERPREARGSRAARRRTLPRGLVVLETRWSRLAMPRSHRSRSVDRSQRVRRTAGSPTVRRDSGPSRSEEPSAPADREQDSPQLPARMAELR